ncbi:FecR domain-containing protein [Dyadobacter sp. LHD-138]|uniref:FecR family protein n=1 Tax=Dyadobacter sp. LHD-138 TaxID=3071413 RepID=UPI0027E02A99|nr:FecR domain-containing protein [Dyadobacter sp. LHD-138]MDQ6479423.1 DUF4974 domain-containing protein [Dyadobacter sp. LHD-138]
MSNQEIQALLLRYRQGKCTVEEIRKIHAWYENLNRDASLSLDNEEKELIEKRLLKKIRKDIQPEKSHEELLVSGSWWQRTAWYSAAAAVFITALTYTWFFSISVTDKVAHAEPLLLQVPSGKLITYENKTGKPKQIILEDKSVVTLYPGSKMMCADHFSENKRDVQLIGNAFFQITKNPKKPFLVYSGKLITRVLGTSFSIKTNIRDKALEVEVVTGKVSVFENNAAFKNTDLAVAAMKNNNGVVLTPNQRVTYFPESRHLMTGLVAEPVKVEIAAKIQPKLTFNNVPLAEIISQLEDEYAIDIVFANDRLAQCTFTGDVSEMPLYEKLDLLCKSNLASYEIRGTRILINGEGCD